MDPKPDSRHRFDAAPPVIEPGHTFSTITEKISAIVLTRRHPLAWFIVSGIGFLFVNVLGCRSATCS